MKKYLLFILSLYCNYLFATTFVYRGDTRPPSEIFQTGFIAWLPGSSGNTNLLLHVAGTTIAANRRISSLISTTFESSAVLDIVSQNSGDLPIYVYQIRSDRHFYNVGNTFNHYSHNATVATSNEERASIISLATLYAGESEAIVLNEIETTHISSAIEYRFNEQRGNYEPVRTYQNPHYQTDDTDINPNPYPISHQDVLDYMNRSQLFVASVITPSGRYSSSLCPEAVGISPMLNNNKLNSPNLGCRKVELGYILPYWLHFLNSSAIPNKPNSLLFNGLNGNVYLINLQNSNPQAKNLGSPEKNIEILALVATESQVFVSTGTGKTYFKNLTTVAKWQKIKQKFQAETTAMISAYPCSNAIFLSTTSGKFFRGPGLKGKWKTIGQLPSPISSLAADTTNCNIYIGTNSGKVYQHHIVATGNPFWELSGGIDKNDPISALQVDNKQRYLYAGTLGGKLYRKAFDLVDRPWDLIGKLSSSITAMGISTTDPNLPAYIYAGTSVGSVYVRNAENDTQWWSLGSPAGPGVVDSLSLVPKVGATLLNSYGLLYKRDYSDGVWRKVGQY